MIGQVVEGVVRLTPMLCDAQRERIVALYRQAAEWSGAPNGEADAMRKIDALCESLRDDCAVAFVELRCGAAVGFVWAYRIDCHGERRMHVAYLSVDVAWRRCGVGARLLEAVETEARMWGIGTVYLHVDAGNATAQAFYASQGYCAERIQVCKPVC